MLVAVRGSNQFRFLPKVMSLSLTMGIELIFFKKGGGVRLLKNYKMSPLHSPIEAIHLGNNHQMASEAIYRTLMGKLSQMD